MVNYASAFSQSELGKYFEWIIIYINERFVKLTLSGKNIKNRPDKILRLSMLGVMLRNMTWHWI